MAGEAQLIGSKNGKLGIVLHAYHLRRWNQQKHEFSASLGCTSKHVSKRKEKNQSRDGGYSIIPSPPPIASPSDQQFISTLSWQTSGVSKQPRHVLDASVESLVFEHMEKDRISCSLLRWRGPQSFKSLFFIFTPPLWYDDMSLSLSPVLEAWGLYSHLYSLSSCKNITIGLAMASLFSSATAAWLLCFPSLHHLLTRAAPIAT